MNDGYLTLLSSTRAGHLAIPSESFRVRGEKTCVYVVVDLRRISAEICTLQNQQGQNIYLPIYFAR